MIRRVVLNLPHSNQIEAMATSEGAGQFLFEFPKDHTWPATLRYLMRFTEELNNHAFYVTCRLANDEFYNSQREMAYFITSYERLDSIYLRLRFVSGNPFDREVELEEQPVEWEAEGF